MQAQSFFPFLLFHLPAQCMCVRSFQSAEVVHDNVHYSMLLVSTLHAAVASARAAAAAAAAAML